MFDLIIKNGSVVMPDGIKICDIAVKDGVIAEISDNITQSAVQIINALGKTIMAGMIDTHFHASDPGGIRSDWEGYITGTKSLAKGGITSFIDMPLNNLPATVDCETLAIKRKNAQEKCYVDFGFFGGVVPGNHEELGKMQKDGAIAFKAFLATCGDRSIPDDFCNVDDFDLYMAMSEIAKADGLMCVHAENASVTDRLGAKMKSEGKSDMMSYVNSRPKWTETEAVMRAIIIAQNTGCRLHIMHVSNPDTIKAIETANSLGSHVTFESCPHYLVFSHDDFEKYGTALKCSPPIRSAEDKEKMWNLLFEGRIPVLSSDHSPCPFKMKDYDNAFDAWGGISGAQNSLDLMYSEAVVKRGMDPHKLSKILSENPAAIYGIKNKGKICEGYDADLVILNDKKHYVLTDDMLMYQNKFSPYCGMKIECTVEKTLVRGTVVYDSELGICGDPSGKEISK